MFLLFFFFNDTATTEIYPLSLHDALPICGHGAAAGTAGGLRVRGPVVGQGAASCHCRACLLGEKGHTEDTRRAEDRKSTRLNSSHLVISYAVFCLKKKKTRQHSCTLDS